MIYVTRHGQTDWNIEKRKQGHIDIPLNSTGRKQAEELGTTLSDIKFDYVFSSPLSRAKETCEITLSKNKYKNKSYFIEPRIIERAFGEFEGLTEKDFDYPSFWNSTAK